MLAQQTERYFGEYPFFAEYTPRRVTIYSVQRIRRYFRLLVRQKFLPRRTANSYSNALRARRNDFYFDRHWNLHTDRDPPR